jgi:hypothetical protein
MASTHKAWRLHALNDLRFEEVETGTPAVDGILVKVEAAMVLSYMAKVLSGAVALRSSSNAFRARHQCHCARYGNGRECIAC